jgi:hypothetical protein
MAVQVIVLAVAVAVQVLHHQVVQVVMQEVELVQQGLLVVVVAAEERLKTKL